MIMTHKTIPSLLCRIIGHKWMLKIRDEKTHHGFVMIEHHQMRGCQRCGETNPNYHEDPVKL